MISTFETLLFFTSLPLFFPTFLQIFSCSFLHLFPYLYVLFYPLYNFGSRRPIESELPKINTGSGSSPCRSPNHIFPFPPLPFLGALSLSSSLPPPPFKKMPWAETPENTLNQDLYVQLFPLSETELKTVRSSSPSSSLSLFLPVLSFELTFLSRSSTDCNEVRFSPHDLPELHVVCSHHSGGLGGAEEV